MAACCKLRLFLTKVSGVVVRKGDVNSTKTLRQHENERTVLDKKTT